jgi:hypothetical protein
MSGRVARSGDDRAAGDVDRRGGDGAVDGAHGVVDRSLEVDLRHGGGAAGIGDLGATRSKVASVRPARCTVAPLTGERARRALPHHHLGGIRRTCRDDSRPDAPVGRFPPSSPRAVAAALEVDDEAVDDPRAAFDDGVQLGRAEAPPPRLRTMTERGTYVISGRSDATTRVWAAGTSRR